MHLRPQPRRDASAFTILEVLVSALLIALAMGSIMAINSQALHTLRATHEVAAGSQVLQQRVEMLRGQSWTEISNSTGLLRLMSKATESEHEMSDAHLAETLIVTVPVSSPTGPVESTRTGNLRRADQAATIGRAFDFSAEPTLLFQGTITWCDTHGVHRRTLRTFLCRAGLTRSGIFGSALGRAGITP